MREEGYQDEARSIYGFGVRPGHRCLGACKCGDYGEPLRQQWRRHEHGNQLHIMFNGVAGTFGNPMANTSPFVDIYEFDISQAGLLGLTLSSVASGASADVSFSLVRLNPPMGGGSNVLLTQGSTGTVEFYSISNLAAVAGNYRLRLEGTIANPPASYSGTISFAPRAVPEPATWAMMVLGFGVVGGVVRRRKASVAFA